MRITLKTAHGKYVSAQPDGRFEVRDAVGPWEEFEATGLDVPPIPPQPQPPSGDWLGIPPSQSAEYVAQIKAKLQSMGHDLAGSCGAWDIANNVAWGLRAQRFGLLEKSGGNNCHGFATDIVMPNTGTGIIVDILGDGGGNNTPAWNASAPGEVDPGRWRPPVQP
jgi:hypothetical protein